MTQPEHCSAYLRQAFRRACKDKRSSKLDRYIELPNRRVKLLLVRQRFVDLLARLVDDGANLLAHRGIIVLKTLVDSCD